MTAVYSTESAILLSVVDDFVFSNSAKEGETKKDVERREQEANAGAAYYVAIPNTIKRRKRHVRSSLSKIETKRSSHSYPSKL